MLDVLLSLWRGRSVTTSASLFPPEAQHYLLTTNQDAMPLLFANQDALPLLFANQDALPLLFANQDALPLLSAGAICGSCV